MNEDPIVAEVRRAREKLARQFDYNIHAIFADLRKREQSEDPSHPVVTDANQWVEANQNTLALRERPKP
jgi:hypothetical protein